MIVEVKDVENDYTACIFCRTGVYKDSHLVYPYEKVIEFRGDHAPSFTATICQKCLAELIDKAEGLL